MRRREALLEAVVVKRGETQNYTQHWGKQVKICVQDNASDAERTKSM